MRWRPGPACFTAALACLYLPAQTSHSSYAFVDITVVPMDAGPAIRTHQTVIVQDTRIAQIGSASALSAAGIENILSGRGKFMIPGLADMHVHLQDDMSPLVNKAILTLFVANGVTTVRNMFGTPDHLLLRKLIADGKLLGPRVLTTGPALDGRPTRLPRSIAVTTPAEANRVVAVQKAMGFDAIKVYNSLTKEVYDTVIAAARREGIPVVGHVPVAVGLAGAISSGQRSIEHLDGYVDAIESDASPYRQATDWRSRMLAFSYIDTGRLAGIVRKTFEAGAWNCPTLVVSDKWLPPSQRKVLMTSPEVTYVPKSIVNRWEPTLPFRGLDQAGYNQFRTAQAERRRIVLALSRAGCGILAGTDTPSPYVVPGYSVVKELEDFVQAGLTPMEALRSATIAPAKFLGMDGEFGSLEPGKSADLVVLNGNPLESIDYLKQISGVMLRGRWLPASELERMLRALAQSN